MNVIPDFKASTIIPLLTRNIAPGSTIYTDGLKSFEGLKEAGFQHIARIQPLRSELRKGAKSAVPLADRAIGNLQQWLIGTHHGVSKGQLQLRQPGCSRFAASCPAPVRRSRSSAPNRLPKRF